MELLRFALEEFQICFLGWFVFLSRLVFEFFQKCFGRPRGRLRTARQQTGGLPGSYLLRPPGSYLLRPPWLIFAEVFFWEGDDIAEGTAGGPAGCFMKGGVHCGFDALCCYRE